MSERLPLPAELLGRHSRPPSVDPHTNGIAHKLLALADRGDYLEAAEQAADLLRGNEDDVRLIAVYLVGLFVERGPASLPDVLANVERLLGQPTTQAIESAIQWLFRAIGDRVAFHTQQRDATWDAWLQQVTPAHLDEIAAYSERILAQSPGGTSMLRKLARWATKKLGPAVARVPKLAPAQVEREATPLALDPEGPRAPSWDEEDVETDEPRGAGLGSAPDEPDEPDDDGGPDEFDELGGLDGFDEPDEPSWGQPIADERQDPRERDDSFMRPGASRPGADEQFESPALAELRDKLRGFELVLARGELDKAAIIARDVQTIIDSFDPITYLPSLFARHFKLLRRCVHELERHWNDDSAARRVLAQLYRADLDGFIND